MLRMENGTREQNWDSVRAQLRSFCARELVREPGVPSSGSLLHLPARFSAQLSGRRTN